MSGALLILAISLTSLAAKAATSEELFMRNCSACHGKDGKGNTPAGKKIGAKDLTISKTTPAEILKQINEGKKDNKGVVKMPAFGGKIPDNEIQTLADFILGLRKNSQ